MMESFTNPDQGKTLRRRRGVHLIALVLLTLCAGGANMVCPTDACVDGMQIDDTEVAVKLINESSSPVHLFSSAERRDSCNRVAGFGGSRFIFVPAGRIGFTVRAVSEGTSLGEVTCTLPEESTVRYRQPGGLSCAGA